MTNLDFFNRNKNIKWQMPSPPPYVETDEDLASWLVNKADIGWLELDIEIDITKWKEEAKTSFPYLVPHRESESKGWNSACIHGIDVSSTGSWNTYGYKDEKDVPYKWTELSNLTPAITNFWKNFPYESYNRIRFMEVESNGFISPHSDMPGKLPGELNWDVLERGAAINVAIIHPNDCFLTVDRFGNVPFKEGKAFMVNIRNRHSVVNFSNTNRIHLIANGRPGKNKKDFIDLIVRSYRKQYERDRI